MRPENFVGVGQQNFSQTNSAEAQASPKTENSKASSDKSQSSTFNKLNIKPHRYMSHLMAILAILAIVSIGRINASEALSIRGSGSTKDQTSMITTGAILATSTQSVIAEDVSKKARDLTNVSSLSISGDEFLTNKSSVVAAGSPSRSIISYKTKQGDTLSSLSAKFGITTDTIKWANDISDENSIKPGASLTILPVNGILYTSQAGDDILALADRYQSNASLIESFNGLEGKAPEAGMQLVIPDGVKPAPAPSYVNRVASSSSGSGFYSNSRLSGNGNSYYWGQCTWYVASRRYVPNNWGNAWTWYANAQYAGYATGSAPRAGAIGWEFKNHVVYVESVNADGTVNISEMNYGGRPGVRHDRTNLPASTFLYIY
ncbi:LysM peptidoglycan-binding domain-containing protein [Candidatus Saccharibacteria bacterium]|nr:LysM peptidoglycan-binding domain-containing protein [Candidatus Saccharibacteria bacterium]